MKQQTPLQEIIEWMEDTEYRFPNNTDSTIAIILIKVKHLLEKEKQMVKMAFEDGKTVGFLELKDKTEDYFNNKYNTK